MKNLKSAMPERKFSEKFTTVRKDVIASSMKELQENREKDVASICLFIWDEMVNRGLANDPHEIAPFIENNFDGIYDFLLDKLGYEPVSEVYAVSYYNEHDDNLSFADTTIAQCFPDDLHIADIELADNSKKALRKPKVKGFRNFPGLHLFGEYLDRLSAIGTARGVKRLSLMVGGSELYPVFKRHGFVISDTPTAKFAFQLAGEGFPMIRKI